MNSKTREWSTPVEVADHFRVKVPTLRLWARRGAPHLKAGRLIRFNVPKLQHWLEQHADK